MLRWSSLGNGTKAVVGAGVALILILLFLLFGNGQVGPVQIASAPDGDTTDAAPQTVDGDDPAQTEPSAEGGDDATQDDGEDSASSGVELATSSNPETGEDTSAEVDQSNAQTGADDVVMTGAEEQTAQADASPADEPDVAASAGANGDSGSQSATLGQSDESVEESAVEEAASAPLPEPPVFDLVRVEADGTALIAGQGLPGAIVTLLLNGKELASETVDSGGNFVAFTMVPGSDQPQTLAIRMSTSDNSTTVMSTQTVMIAPATRTLPTEIAEASPMPEAPTQVEEAPSTVSNETVAALESGTAGALGIPASDGIGQGVATAATDLSERPNSTTELPTTSTPDVDDVPAIGAAPEVSSQTAELTAPLDEPEQAISTPTADKEAPKVLIADTDGVRVLQDGGAGPDVLDVIALDTISYDEQGDVTLAGRGTGTGFVRVYIDNEPIKTLEIDATGRWRAPLPEVDTGIYTLRIDELDEEGGVVSRVETPFKREEPEVLAAVMAEQGLGAGEVTVMTVQKGDTLWDISRANYGAGIQYVRVFEANRDRIRDPHWIYPGQVFTLPKAEE